MQTINLVLQAEVQYHKYGNEVTMVRHWLNRSWEMQLQHCYHEENFCADILAKKGAKSDILFVFLVSARV